MLREATSASNDDSCRDHTDIVTVPDDARLGADLDGAPAEVRAAAVARSRRFPGPSVMRAAWLSLPVDVRDRIGVMALTHTSHSVALAEYHGRHLTLSGAKLCEDRSDAALNGIETTATAALPMLFASPEDEAEPLWAQRDGEAVVFPATSHASALTEAIAVHLRAELDLAAALGTPEEEAQRGAEDDAYRAVIAAQPRDRADLVALYEHLAQDAGEPAAEPLARVLDALALALQVGTETRLCAA